MSGGFSDAGAVFPAGALHIPLYPGLLCPGRRTGWGETGGNRHLYAGTGEWGADSGMIAQEEKAGYNRKKMLIGKDRCSGKQ